ncbi:hypothetical protein ABQG68_18435 [Bacillus pumilus]|uniref:hypothetical protein n=1 Tax=Bacillus pumilus TaxID=1408 RepID=UPI0033163575
MKTITKSLMLSTSLVLFASPFALSAKAAPIPHEQVTAQSDFQLPTVTETIKRNIELSFEKQEKWLSQLELIAGEEKRKLVEEFFVEHISPALQNLLEEPSLKWNQVDHAIYQSLVQSGIPFLAAKAIAHGVTLSLKKM